MKWVSEPPTARGIRGLFARALFKHRRRNMEAALFCEGNWGNWRRVRDENIEMGVYKR